MRGRRLKRERSLRIVGIVDGSSVRRPLGLIPKPRYLSVERERMNEEENGVLLGL